MPYLPKYLVLNFFPIWAYFRKIRISGFDDQVIQSVSIFVNSFFNWSDKTSGEN